jgi:hypothetical protein
VLTLGQYTFGSCDVSEMILSNSHHLLNSKSRRGLHDLSWQYAVFCDNVCHLL